MQRYRSRILQLSCQPVYRFVFINSFYVVNSAVTSSLRTDHGTTEGTSLTCDRAVLECTADLTVLAIQIADLTSAYAKVTSRDIYIRTNVTV